jgi:aspartyl-tRNA(Asn)/glutamyl-tRNA(Gln) amidotransferase subunit B
MAKDTISSKQGKQVLEAVLDEDKDPAVIVEERGMKQVSDTGAIEAVVDAVLAANPDKVEAYKGGKTGLIGFFVGQCMKEMRGQGNPKVINQLLVQKLR